MLSAQSASLPSPNAPPCSSWLMWWPWRQRRASQALPGLAAAPLAAPGRLHPHHLRPRPPPRPQSPSRSVNASARANPCSPPRVPGARLLGSCTAPRVLDSQCPVFRARPNPEPFPDPLHRTQVWDLRIFHSHRRPETPTSSVYSAGPDSENPRHTLRFWAANPTC